MKKSEIKKLEKFNNWMQKIKNYYYSYNEKMCNAYQIILKKTL